MYLQGRIFIILLCANLISFVHPLLCFVSYSQLGIHDRLQWKIHQMIFAMQELPGEFTTFDFIPGIPAPFNFGLAILMNQKMLTLGEKLQTAPPLLPMLIEGQDFIDAQDELSVLSLIHI